VAEWLRRSLKELLFIFGGYQLILMITKFKQNKLITINQINLKIKNLALLSEWRWRGPLPARPIAIQHRRVDVQDVV
jgi:hypothetical protein